MDYYLITFDGDLLFHNNCRPIVVVAKYEKFNTEREVIKFIVETKSSAEDHDEGSNDDNYIEYSEEFDLLCKASGITRDEVENLSDDRLIDICCKNLDASWLGDYSGIAAAIVADTKVLKIIRYCAGSDAISGYKNPITFTNPYPSHTQTLYNPVLDSTQKSK